MSQSMTAATHLTCSIETNPAPRLEKGTKRSHDGDTNDKIKQAKIETNPGPKAPRQPMKTDLYASVIDLLVADRSAASVIFTLPDSEQTRRQSQGCLATPPPRRDAKRKVMSPVNHIEVSHDLMLSGSSNDSALFDQALNEASEVRDRPSKGDRSCRRQVYYSDEDDSNEPIKWGHDADPPISYMDTLTWNRIADPLGEARMLNKKYILRPGRRPVLRYPGCTIIDNKYDQNGRYKYIQQIKRKTGRESLHELLTFDDDFTIVPTRMLPAPWMCAETVDWRPATPRHRQSMSWSERLRRANLVEPSSLPVPQARLVGVELNPRPADGEPTSNDSRVRPTRDAIRTQNRINIVIKAAGPMLH